MTYITSQPIVFVGTGQTYNDLRSLNARAVVNALMKAWLSRIMCTKVLSWIWLWVDQPVATTYSVKVLRDSTLLFQVFLEIMNIPASSDSTLQNLI